MNKHLKILIALLSSIFALAACGQNNSAGTTAETTQTAQETTTAPTTQVASNKQNTTEALPKDGVQRFKRVDKGGSTFLIYYFKDYIDAIQINFLRPNQNQ